MKIYIDKEFKCHAANPDGAFREVEARFFDGKCTEFIEGYRYVPDGDSWTDAKGHTFTGLMISPWKDFYELDAAQRAYERALLAEYESLINELYSEVTEE